MTGTPVAAGRIDLAWTAATDNVGVAGYNVYRDGIKVNTVPIGSTTYSDTGLTADVNHTYAVTAIDTAANESAQSGTYTGAAGSGAVTTAYTYDAENRLTQLQSDSNVIGSYAYDGAGDRYAKTAVGVTTAYTLDLASSLPQVLSETAGSAVTSYAYAAGPLELDKSGTTYWYLSDTLGSVRLVTDSTGATPATYAYAAFGSTRKSTGTLANEVRFTGQRTDGESGLEFLRARTYDPSTGSFLQRDSWGISPTDSQSIDAYAYTDNNPINATDPTGHWFGIDDAIASGIGAVGGAVVTLGTDVVTGQGVKIDHIVSGAAGGAAWMEVMHNVPGCFACAGAAAGFAQDGTQQAWNWVASGGKNGPDVTELATSTATGGILGQAQKIAGPLVASKLRSSPLGDVMKNLVNKVGGIEIGGVKPFDNPLVRLGGSQIRNKLIPKEEWEPQGPKGKVPLPGGLKDITRLSIGGGGFPFSIHIDSRNWWNPYAWFTQVGPLSTRR